MEGAKELGENRGRDIRWQRHMERVEERIKIEACENRGQAQ